MKRDYANSDSATYCQIAGGYLAEFETQAELDAFKHLHPSGGGWISGNDKLLEGTFVWNSGGEIPFPIIQEFEQSDRQNQDCLWCYMGTLQDAVCNTLRRFICKLYPKML